MSDTTYDLGPLNLSDADTSGFEAIPASRYNAEVFSITTDTVKNADGTGKLPAGTPQVKVQFVVTDEPYQKRRLFQTYNLPPDDYENAARLKGMFVSFLLALGVPEETIKSKKGFNPNFDDYVGLPCVVIVGQRPYNGEITNTVKGVKPAGSIAGSEDSGGLL